MNATEAKTETVNAQENGAKGGNGRRRAGLVLLLLVLTGISLACWFWYKSKIEVTTDDAFVAASVHMVSARIPGHVVRVAVVDNQLVAAGDLLVELDDADYRARLANAEAMLAIARNEADSDHAKVAVAQAALKQAEAKAKQAILDLQRGEALSAREVIPKERFEQLQTSQKVAQARLVEARENLRRAKAAVALSSNGKIEAQVARRAAELELARNNLSYTRITAPVAGYVTRKGVEVGNNIQPGQPLLSLVQQETPWVVANYKERQLTHVEPGQKVSFSVDAYPGESFSGRVESIMAGTGSAFSLLPPENATGNYVKVVQRIPVKIVIDSASDPKHRLRVGMSVVPIIYTGRSLGDIIGQLNPFN